MASIGHSVSDKPELMREWDFQKNKISPESVTPGSGKKCWWKCVSGHSWFAAVYSRRKNGCPACAGKTVDKGSLKTDYPEIASELIAESGFSASSVRPHSNKVGVWRCKACGKTWKAIVNGRVKGSGCPHCSLVGISKLGLRFFCELKVFFKDAVAEMKIGSYRCDVVIPSCRIIVEIDGSRWHRDDVKDRKKSEFLESLGYVVVRARSNPLPIIGKNDVLFSEISEKGIFDGVKRVVGIIGMMTGQRVIEYSGFMNDLEYRGLLRGSKVLPGAGMLDHRPDLLSEWDINNKEDPRRLSYGSKRKVGWICVKGHKWMDSPYARVVTGSDCHFCSGRKLGADNNFEAMFPDISKEWDWDKNKIGPNEVTGRNDMVVWWKCGKGHSWKTAIQNRGKGRGCPYCAGRLPTIDRNLKTTFPEIADEWDLEKNVNGPDEYLPMSNKKVWWSCGKCGEKWESIIAARVLGYGGCTKCGKK
jgi:protein-arginine kinase activator protein McsA